MCETNKYFYVKCGVLPHPAMRWSSHRTGGQCRQHPGQQQRSWRFSSEGGRCCKEKKIKIEKKLKYADIKFMNTSHS